MGTSPHAAEYRRRWMAAYGRLRHIRNVSCCEDEIRWGCSRLPEQLSSCRSYRAVAHIKSCCQHCMGVLQNGQEISRSSGLLDSVCVSTQVMAVGRVNERVGLSLTECNFSGGVQGDRRSAAVKRVRLFL